ncbi:MAG: hypothetical protein ACI8O8_002310 [Oleiphilaceae bacterium]|jgi:hypothetical protein
MNGVNNVINIKSNKRSMTSVSIEETDESWALKLLNEFERVDEPIIVEEHKFIDSRLHSDFEELSASSPSLSAIENQFLILAEKQKAQALLEHTSKLKPRFNLVRIKNFFLA